jgi:hypothetical protein
MEYFTKLPAKLPPITSDLINPYKTIVSVIDPTNIIKLLDLPWSKKDIRLIQIWLKPHTNILIHKDKDAILDNRALWSLLLPVENYTPAIAKIYTSLDDSKIVIIPYETGPVPLLDNKYAKLVETYDISSGPALFDSGTEWHGATNDTDNVHHCVSLRSSTITRQEIFDYLVKRWPL